jgi:hypothetical protein
MQDLVPATTTASLAASAISLSRVAIKLVGVIVLAD